ncbi:uncharacterized protein CEXT_157421 [Caerostris extrusa]|uniref:Uncharacterized protein n=1 Tax=Caerostris extrusa TaxID=172846 RepID=A0AAV4UWH8_CAEEX|nr:uncharacterized protein CEXT_157421 [Caerostris extrusa]
MVNNRCVRSIDMMDLIPVGNAEVKGVYFCPRIRISGLSQTPLCHANAWGCAWKRPLCLLITRRLTCRMISRKRKCPQSRCESRRSKNVMHVPTKKTANKVKKMAGKAEKLLTHV